MHDDHAIKNTQPYPGVINTLEKLNSKGISMSVATNKRYAPTIKLINHFDWQEYFTSVECSDSQSQIRNKDEMIQEILKNNNFNKSIFVGDTVNDGLSANLNQLPFILAHYGYGRDQDWSKVSVKKSIQNFTEILRLV